jgi:hypothetical protein
VLPGARPFDLFRRADAPKIRLPKELYASALKAAKQGETVLLVGSSEQLQGETIEPRCLRRWCQLSCGQLDRLALLPFGIEDFDLEIWETPL